MELETVNGSGRINTFYEMHKKAPLFEAIRDYMVKDMSAYHTPGHKQGKGISQEFLDLVGVNVFRMDLCELPEVDNLHDAVTVIKEAQELAASAYSADRSFFLVNGTAIELMAAGKSSLSLPVKKGQYRIENADIPEAAIGYEEDFIVALYDKNQLEIKQPIHYGSWCGRENFLSYQDLILAFKPATDQAGVKR